MKVLKLSSHVSDVSLKVLKLSSEVSKCKPLVLGRRVQRNDIFVNIVGGRGLHSSTFQLNLKRL